MALVEVEDSELRLLQGHKALLDKLGADPKRRAKILPLIKEAIPNISIPELDAAAPLQGQIDELKKALADKEAKEAKEREEAEKQNQVKSAESMIKKGRKTLKAQGYTEEGIQAIEKLMEERGIIDYEAAAAYWEKTNPKDAPVDPNQNWSTASDLLNPPEENPWRAAIEAANKGSGRRTVGNILQRTQNAEINNFFRELRGTRRA